MEKKSVALIGARVVMTGLHVGLPHFLFYFGVMEPTPRPGTHRVPVLGTWDWPRGHELGTPCCSLPHGAGSELPSLCHLFSFPKHPQISSFKTIIFQDPCKRQQSAKYGSHVIWCGHIYAHG